MNFKISISHVIAITLVTGTFISPEVLIILLLFIPMTKNAKRTKKIETKVTTKSLEDMFQKYYQITNSHLKRQ